MNPDPSPELQAKRWENAKQLVTAFKQYCLDNESGFILKDDNLLIIPSQIEITDTEINIRYNRSTYNLYENNIEYDHGVYDTTAEWYADCSLFQSQIVKLIPQESFSEKFYITEDSITLRSNPVADISNLKDLRYVMPLV